MKKKLIILSSILLISIAIAGGTFAWFYAEDSSVSAKSLTTIDVETVGENEDAIVENRGTGDVYVRVRLIPQWSDPNLSVSNINIKIGSGWTRKQADGYYYYKHILKENDFTTNIMNEISHEDLEREYLGQNYNVKVVSEGVQTNKKALKSVWGIDSIPQN